MYDILHVLHVSLYIPLMLYSIFLLGVFGVKLCLIVDQEICKCTYLILRWNYDESQLREKLLCT